MKNTKLNYINFSKNELDELFSEAKQGNSQAFKDLSIKIRNIAYSYFLSKRNYKKIINIEDVEDLTNNVFLAFAEQYQNVENIENWLRRVLFFNFISWYKKNNARRSLELDEAFYVRDESLDSQDKTDVSLILNQMKKLTKEKQQILKLRFWEGLKFGEIAEIMNKSEDAVKKMFSRTIMEIKNMI